MIKMLRGLPLKLNLQSRATPEFIENGCNVVGSLVNVIKSARFKTQQTTLLMKLNGHTMKIWAINYPTLVFGLHLKEFQTKRSKPTSLFENNCYVTNFQQKAQIFNDYFAEQCKINDNGILLPEFISKTNASISQINITTNQIIDIIQKHSTKKSHGCVDISVTMLQLCPTQVAVPLQLIFQKCVLTGAFPDSWKCANVVPIHKKIAVS